MSKRKKAPSQRQKEQKEQTKPLVEEETPVAPTPVAPAPVATPVTPTSVEPTLATEGEEVQSAPGGGEVRPPDAERITVTAIEFLKRLGNRRSLRPRRVSREGEVYTVEVGLRKGTAVVQVDATTDMVREYEISEEGGSSFSLPLSPKTVLFICGIVALIYFVFSLLGLQSIISGILR